MKTSTLILSALLCTPFTARAQAAAPTPEQMQARHQRMESRMRVMRVVGLSEALGLDEAGALRLDAQMKPFDDQRSPLHEALRADSKILHDAADGDPSAGTQVDAALGRMFDNRAKLEQINHQMLEALSKGLQPQQKAKLAVFLASFGHGGEHGQREHGRGGHGAPRAE